MRPGGSHVLALFLGISLTVGFYEGRRLVVNTWRAVQATQQQLSAKRAQRAERHEVREATARGEAPARPAARVPARRAAEVRRERGRGALTDDVRQELRGAADRTRSGELGRREALQGLSPEARQAVLERRARRRVARELRGAGRAGARQTEAGPARPRQASRGRPEPAEADTPLDELPMEELLDELERFEDTGLQ